MQRECPAKSAQLDAAQHRRLTNWHEFEAVTVYLDSQLLGPTKWTYFYLYVVLDVYSRYVVGSGWSPTVSRLRWPTG